MRRGAGRGRGCRRCRAGPGRAAAGGPAARVPLRQLMDDRLLDALLERSRDEAGGLRLTGEGSMLGELVKAVLERALEGELTAHLGYEQNDRAGRGGGPANYRNGTHRQDGADRRRAGGPGRAAGPGGHVRAAAGAQAGRAGRRRPG